MVIARLSTTAASATSVTVPQHQQQTNSSDSDEKLDSSGFEFPYSVSGSDAGDIAEIISAIDIY